MYEVRFAVALPFPFPLPLPLLLEVENSRHSLLAAADVMCAP
jgi:hypothetical protein